MLSMMNTYMIYIEIWHYPTLRPVVCVEGDHCKMKELNLFPSTVDLCICDLLFLKLLCANSLDKTLSKTMSRSVLAGLLY